MRFLFFLCLVLVAGAQGRAENWGQWRGPLFNGSTTETNLPEKWTKTENVAWATALPGYSGATPVVWGDRIFLPSPDEQKKLALFCIARLDGSVLWQKPVGTGDRDKGRNNMASPSPVTDGNAVFVLFATGDLAAFDFDGKELWARDLGKDYGRFANMWIYGSSPMLHNGKLYVQVLQRSPVPRDYSHAQDGRSERESYLLCIDPVTGRDLWRHVRPSDAKNESMEAYTTPIPYEGKAGPQIIVVGGDYVTGHSPEGGAELWRCGGLNRRGDSWWRIVPSPVVAGEMIIACAPKRDPVLGIRPDGKGVVTDTHVAWQFKENPSDCVTPLYYLGKLFVLDGDRQVLSCLDPQTGERKWRGELPVREIFRASPTGADGKIYCIGESGTAVVLSAGDEFKVLSTIAMGESPVRSSIAVSGRQLFIRTAKHLYCVGKVSEAKPQ